MEDDEYSVKNKKFQGGEYMYNAVLVGLENTYLEPEEKIRKVCCECSACGEEICEGDDCYEILGLTICESCIDDSHGYAELEDAI